MTQNKETEKLVCGCGGEAKSLLHDKNPNDIRFFEFCDKCGLITGSYKYKAEAIAAFRLATRADIKQGIQWISVKDRLPEEDCNYDLLVMTHHGVKFGIYIGVDGRLFSVDGWGFQIPVTHWAFINLPESEK